MKPYIIIVAVSLGIMILGSVLHSSGIVNIESLDSKWETVVKLIYLALFFIMAYALMPLFVRVFIIGQKKIGNAEFFLVKWIIKNEQTIVYCYWGLITIGLVIMLFFLGDILKDWKK